MNQTPKRRPKPVTQRDGTTLQNSNCRMASASTGLDFHTVGAKTSSAGKMRSYTSDQTGGTGSDDAKEAWQRGFKQSLIIKDGGSWASVLAALREGRGVNLDVWHEYLPSGCISGAGRYGHNIYVHPDFDGKWLVSDPWCKPAKWQRIPEKELKRAAEKWGAMVREQTGLREPTVTLLRIAARILMGLFRPGQEMPVGHPDEVESDEYFETGGYTPVMFTTTTRQPLLTQEDEMDPLFSSGGRQRTFPKGTPVYDAPGGKQVGTIGDATVVYRLIAQDKATAEGWYLLDGGGEDGQMRWVKKPA